MQPVREFSSAGLEHLPYKQRVGGSIPSTPTERSLESDLFYFNLVMFYVYILKSEKSGSYYKGQTANLERRIREHNNGEEKSTSRYVPWVLVWHTIVGSRSEALALEQKLKNMTGAKRIEDFINRHSTN